MLPDHPPPDQPQPEGAVDGAGGRRAAQEEAVGPHPATGARHAAARQPGQRRLVLEPGAGSSSCEAAKFPSSQRRIRRKFRKLRKLRELRELRELRKLRKLSGNVSFNSSLESKHMKLTDLV